MPTIDSIAEKIRAHLAAKYAAREIAIQLSREIIRFSANAIRAAHRDEYDRSSELLTKARASLAEVKKALTDHPDIMFAGFVQDAEKEYAEASTTLAIFAGQPLPDPDDLGVGYAPYLNGVGETAGELRRHVLDTIRHGEAEQAERFLDTMDDILAVLVTMDFPDGMTGGLRRTTDLVRGVLEKTRGDLTLILKQRELEKNLRQLQDRLGSSS